MTNDESPHKLSPNRQRQQRRLQRCEYLFQDYPKFAPNCQRFAVFNILQGCGCQTLDNRIRKSNLVFTASAVFSNFFVFGFANSQTHSNRSVFCASLEIGLRVNDWKDYQNLG